MIGRLIRTGWRLMRSPLARRGMESAALAVAGAAARRASKSFRKVFKVNLPTTVYVRGSGCEVTVERGAEPDQVELVASLTAHFGLEFVTEQDIEGIYIVVKRKPVIGSAARVRFTVIVPPGANVMLHLTPGSVNLPQLDGKLTIPAMLDQSTRLAPLEEAPAPKRLQAGKG